MDNTNISKDVDISKDAAETPADKNSAESIKETSVASMAPIAKSQSTDTEPKAEAPEFAKADDACSAREGDTLLAIANRHKVSLGLLKVLNGIDDALKQLDKGKLIKFK